MKSTNRKKTSTSKSKTYLLKVKASQLKELFQMVILYEAVIEGTKSAKKSPTAMYTQLKQYFKDSETDTLVRKAYELLSDYIEKENEDEISLLMDEEKEAVSSFVKEEDGNKILEEFLGKYNDRSKSIGILKLLSNNKKQDD